MTELYCELSSSRAATHLRQEDCRRIQGLTSGTLVLCCRSLVLCHPCAGLHQSPQNPGSRTSVCRGRQRSLCVRYPCIIWAAEVPFRPLLWTCGRQVTGSADWLIDSMKAWGATLDPNGKSGVSDEQPVSHCSHRLAFPTNHSKPFLGPPSPFLPLPLLPSPALLRAPESRCTYPLPHFRAGDDHIGLAFAPFEA